MNRDSQFDPNSRSGKSTAGKIGIGCCSVFLILLLFLGLRWSEGTSTPILTIPSKSGPSPNAFDTYRSATALIQNSNKVSDAIDPKTKFSFQQREALVTSNQPAIDMLRSGFSQEYYDTSVRSVSTLFPYYAQLRGMARLLSLDATVRAEKGDWNGAVRSDLDCVRMGEDIPHGTPLIGGLVGIACQAIGRRNLWKYIDHLDAGEARAAAERLTDIQTHNVPYADTLTEERYFSISALNMVFKSNNLSGLVGPQNGAGAPPAAYSLLFLVYSKHSIAANNQKLFDQLIANARKPYASHVPVPPTPNDPINQIIAPVFSQATIKYADSETQNGLLAISFALHAYFKERGSYPATLAELAPGYLKRLPDDPFALSGTFKYRRTGDTYLLYSIGPDSVDDGGKAIYDASKSSSGSTNSRYFVDPDSKGDIVAGKNIY